jgi:hypothetical protein
VTVGVKVSYDDLGDLSTQLKHIIDEFESAGSRRRDLEDAVETPYDKDDLKDAAHDFEGRWDDRRKRLMDNCKGVAEHLDGVIAAFKGFDEDAARKSENG